MSLITLSELKKNEVGEIVGFSTKGSYRRQLLSLGLTPGARIRMVRHAPLGDPVEFELLGFNLCLRKSEASCVKVQRQVSE